MTTQKSSPTPKVIRLDVESLREQLGLNKKQMAERIGVSQTAYLALSRNPTQIRFTTLLGILSIPNVSLTDIFVIE